MNIIAAFSAILSICDVGVPSAPMHTFSLLDAESGIRAIASRTASAMPESISTVIMRCLMR